jgi:ubiquinone/menaquinone biosynthesis C-methylase UbiE
MAGMRLCCRVPDQKIEFERSRIASISTRYDRERAFHDEAFAHDTRASAAKAYSITDASERRYRERLERYGPDSDVLECGCGPASHAFALAGARVTGVDLSPVAIELATERAVAEGVAESTAFEVMNAEDLRFPDSSFDLVCGTAILHHLRLDQAYAEVARTLRPGGRAVFLEPLGHNRLINAYRRATPSLRTVDEHPLRMEDLRLAGTHFGDVRFEYFHLAALAALPIRAARESQRLISALDDVDRQVFRRVPACRRYAWIVMMDLGQPQRR